MDWFPGGDTKIFFSSWFGPGTLEVGAGDRTGINAFDPSEWVMSGIGEITDTLTEGVTIGGK